MPNASDIGLRLRKARQLRGLTTRAAAALVGVNESHVSRVECGKTQPSETFLTACALRLGISEDWLRQGRGEMDAPRHGEVVDLSRVEAPLARLQAAVSRIWRFGTEEHRRAVEGVVTALDPGEKKERLGGDEADDGVAGGAA